MKKWKLYDPPDRLKNSVHWVYSAKGENLPEPFFPVSCVFQVLGHVDYFGVTSGVFWQPVEKAYGKELIAWKQWEKEFRAVVIAWLYLPQHTVLSSAELQQLEVAGTLKLISEISGDMQ